MFSNDMKFLLPIARRSGVERILSAGLDETRGWNPMAAGEVTLLVTRPTRLIALRYYVGTVVFFLLGGLFYFGIVEALFPAFPSGPVGGWSTHRLVGVVFAVLALLLLLVAELIRKSTRYTITDNKIIRED